MMFVLIFLKKRNYVSTTIYDTFFQVSLLNITVFNSYEQGSLRKVLPIHVVFVRQKRPHLCFHASLLSHRRRPHFFNIVLYFSAIRSLMIARLRLANGISEDLRGLVFSPLRPEKGSNH